MYLRHDFKDEFSKKMNQTSFLGTSHKNLILSAEIWKHIIYLL